MDAAAYTEYVDGVKLYAYTVAHVKVWEKVKVNFVVDLKTFIVICGI